MKSGETPKIIFHEDGHYYEDRDGKPCISVTSVVGLFHEEFDQNYNLTRSALKRALGEDVYKHHKVEQGYNVFPLSMKPPQEFFDYLYPKVDPKKFFESKDFFRQEWELSATKGTSFHADRENELIEAGVANSEFDSEEYKVIIEDKKDYDNCTLKDNLGFLTDGCYPELLVYLELDNVIITGQVDKAYIKPFRVYSSIDYKTNKKIGYMSSSSKFFYPFADLPASKLMKYTMQQTMYSYIMESWGFTLEKQAIIHYKDYEVSKDKLIELEYKKDVAREMIEIVNKKYS